MSIPPPPSTAADARDTARAGAWRAVVGFGVVSLAADMVYEGARSVYGPMLGLLGASATTVGLVTGAGEATALVLRLVSGPLADRTSAYWPLTILGYAMTAICVPLLAFAPAAGALGLVVAVTLILLERAGKAVRSPAKSTLLASVATQVGRGTGFGVHKALDDIGAFAGPLLVAAIIALVGTPWPAMAALAVPGAVTMALLVALRRRLPPPALDPPGPASGAGDTSSAPVGSRRGPVRRSRPLGRPFHLFALSSACSTAGLVTFGLLSFRLVDAGLLPVGLVPVVYALAQVASAVAALGSGAAFDRLGGRVLLALPVLVVGASALGFTRSATLAVAGVLLWGAATGLQDSTVKALVADLVDASGRSTAYGIFAAVQGSAAVLGGALLGRLSEGWVPLLVGVVAASQALGVALLLAALRAQGRPAA